MLSVLTMGAVACVSQGRFDDAVAKTQLTNAQLGKSNEDLASTRAEAARLDALLDEAMRSATTTKSTNADRIAALRKRIDELKAAQAASDKRARLFREFAMRLKEQVDAGDLIIVVRDGRMVLQLPNDVLFDTGKTELKPAGQKTLAGIAGVLSSMNQRHFQIAGHTDDVPIHNERFPSNWELSSGRALRVVHFLVDKGVPPTELSAAGYSDIDPIHPNTTPEARKQNRRTEITLQPEIDELVSLPLGG